MPPIERLLTVGYGYRGGYCPGERSAVKAGEWSRLVEPWLTPREGWSRAGRLAVRLPARWALVGVLGEPSGFGRATYVWTVRSPLYSPSDVLDLSYSSRVGGGAERLDDADPAAVSAAIGKAVTDIATEDEVLQTWARLSLKTANMRMFETAAYAQILTGDPRSARRTLAAARRLARGKDEPDWVRPVFDRMAQLEQLLDGKATADVMDLLDSWAAQTAAALKVPRGLHLAKS